MFSHNPLVQQQLAIIRLFVDWLCFAGQPASPAGESPRLALFCMMEPCGGGVDFSAFRRLAGMRAWRVMTRPSQLTILTIRRSFE